MRKKNFKGKCEKRSLPKFPQGCRTFDDVQYEAANYLIDQEDIVEIACNVPLDGECEEYMSDFVCKKENGDLAIYECERRDYLTKPMSAKLLEMSRQYWLKRGVNDFNIIVEERRGEE